MSPKIILGTMSFGLEHTDASASAVRVRGVESVKPFLDMFKKYGHEELDSARIYCQGHTDQVLGELAPPSSGFKIAAKVYPASPGDHDAVNLPKIFHESLTALKTNKVDVFYLHAPDYTTPFEVTLKVVDDMYRQGMFERFGLSNYSAWQVAQIHGICKRNGYILPTVYQGQYNAITRGIVRELLPCLRAHNMVFYGWNPVAGGFLSGKFNFDSEDNISKGGRFDSKSGFGWMFRGFFWHPVFFSETADRLKIDLLEASLRWMAHHSDLGPEDGVIVGASKLQHLEQNLINLQKGPLPKEMVNAFDQAWEDTKAATPLYYYPAPAPKEE
ncbi:hypothetical protein BGW38_010881 [Lunasporangiospora selenospora]|uniref:NADP-dependent oxidoreductase domain-containing protein n=1 Tax=Lunasporangiospora selenospora TaxID=979761 RepID=A0A9P6KIA4_9FUNG|nr:hypothetical protein BGW38_010881 [Lunasporangiospora selenospora]